MSGERGLGRREFVVLSGTALAGSAGLSGSSEPEFSVELAVTESLADLSEKETGNREYVLELMEEFIDASVRPFVSDFMDVSVEYSGFEPSVDDKADEALREWESVSDGDKCCSLLVTGESYDGPVGLAEEVNDPLESSSALVGEGYDFLDLEQDDWKEEVLVVDYEALDREINYTPWKTVVAGLHEVGHTMGLEHGYGEVYEVEDGVCTSVMSASYTDEFAEEDEVRFSDDIYWSTSFSEKAREKLARSSRS